MYVFAKDTVASDIDTVDTKENAYIKGQSGFDIQNIRNNMITLIVYFELLSTPLTCIAFDAMFGKPLVSAS